jgi:hypothetical protein
VLVDGEPVYACTREVGTLAGAQITTVEALDGHLLRAASWPSRRPVRLLSFRHPDACQGSFGSQPIAEPDSIYC